MPTFYAKGEYDLAGFVVGVVDKGRVIDGSKISPGDQLIGLASSGLHSNGYSLARKVLFERMGLKPKDKVKGLVRSVGAELLVPTRIYVKPILHLLKNAPIHGMAHITGGGITGNLPRVIPRGCKARIRKNSWPVPPIFRVIQEGGAIQEKEMLRTFNNGIGMILAIPPHKAEKALERLQKMGEKAFLIGEIAKGRSKGERIEYVGSIC
jgi:phosphoribosylformylglycinamidine cyclo-ligase